METNLALGVHELLLICTHENGLVGINLGQGYPSSRNQTSDYSLSLRIIMIGYNVFCGRD